MPEAGALSACSGSAGVARVPMNDRLRDLVLSDLQPSAHSSLYGSAPAEEALRTFKDDAQSTSEDLFAFVDTEQTAVGVSGIRLIEGDAASIWVFAPGAETMARLILNATVKSLVYEYRKHEIYTDFPESDVDGHRLYQSAGFEISEAPSDAKTLRASLTAQGGARRVAMMQPMFAPWLGLFELIDVADVFIFLDDFQFSRQGWGHRNRAFLSPGKTGYITIPIDHPKSLEADFRSIKPRPDARWLKKTVSGLTQSYGKQKGFAEGFPLVQPYFESIASGGASLADIEIGMTEKIASALGLQAEFHRSSEFQVPNQGRSERVLSLIEAVGGEVYYAARGSAEYMVDDGAFDVHPCDVYFQVFEPKPYSQPGGEPFEPRLSVIDALFNLGASGAADLVRGTRRWQPYDEIKSTVSAKLG